VTVLYDTDFLDSTNDGSLVKDYFLTTPPMSMNSLALIVSDYRIINTLYFSGVMHSLYLNDSEYYLSKSIALTACGVCSGTKDALMSYEPVGGAFNPNDDAKKLYKYPANLFNLNLFIGAHEDDKNKANQDRTREISPIVKLILKRVEDRVGIQFPLPSFHVVLVPESANIPYINAFGLLIVK
jgi:hypothetical protein